MRFFIATSVLALASAALAQNSTNSKNATVNLFINDALGGQAAYAASIVTACADQTIYAIRCTSARFAGAATCGPNAPVCASPLATHILSGTTS